MFIFNTPKSSTLIDSFLHIHDFKASTLLTGYDSINNFVIPQDPQAFNDYESPAGDNNSS